MRNARILVVEDEGIVAMDIQHMLEELGYAVVGVAATGPEALNGMKNEPDVVLMDIMLRGDMDGVETAQVIKDEYNVPVVYLTAYSDEDTLNRAKVTEPYGYILKPFHDRELETNIEIALYRHDLEAKLRESQERFRRVFEEGPIGIAIADENLAFSQVNDSFSEMLGFPKSELLERSFHDITHPDFLDMDRSATRRMLERKESVYKTEKKFVKKDGYPLWVSVTVTPMFTTKDEFQYFIAMVEDVTDRKHREREMKKNLMRFELRDGNTYLIKERTAGLSIDALKDLVSTGIQCHVLSRTTEDEYMRGAPSECSFLWLADSTGSNIIPPDLETIKEFVNDLRPGQGIILDRLDFLITKFGFEDVLTLVQGLRETAYMRKHIILLTVDPDVVSPREIRQFEKESNEVMVRQRSSLPEELHEILRFIWEQNTLGVKPSYAMIGNNMDISKPTVRKRIRMLVSSGHLVETKKGRSKVLEITEKGRARFWK